MKDVFQIALKGRPSDSGELMMVFNLTCQTLQLLSLGTNLSLIRGSLLLEGEPDKTATLSSNWEVKLFLHAINKQMSTLYIKQCM